MSETAGRKEVLSPNRPRVAGTLGAFGLLALAALASYHNSLDGPFVFDDVPSIVENSDIRRLATALRENPTIDGVAAGRPLLRISLWINYALGELEVRGYHVQNLILHILATWTLWSVARRILESPRLGDRYREAAWGLALAIALLWTTHPLQTESVTYVVQRAEILGGWFYLLTLYSVARSTESSGLGPLVWSVAAVVSCAMGMASKETVATAPLLALAMDRVFFARSWKRLWQSRGFLYLALACTWIFQAVLVMATSGRNATVGFDLGIDWRQYALTQPYYLCRYLALSVWPSALIFDYGSYLSKNVGEVAPYAAVILLLGGASLVGLWRKPALGFCGAWFFAILAPTSSVVPITTQTGAEHRMYLPLVGLIGPVVLAGYVLWQQASPRLPRASRSAPVLVLFLVAAALGARTIVRNHDYRSELSIWATVVDRWPINPRGHYNLGNALAKMGHLPEAIVQYQTALHLQPDYAQAHVNLGTALAEAGQLPEAIAQYEAALRLEPGVAGGTLPEVIARLKAALHPPGQERRPLGQARSATQR
jgi:hypothetical protein